LKVEAEVEKWQKSREGHSESKCGNLRLEKKTDGFIQPPGVEK